MKRKLLPFVMIAGSLAAVYACSSSSDSTPPTTNTNPEASTQPDTSTTTTDLDSGTAADTSKADTSTPDAAVSDNPLDGIAAPTAVAAVGTIYTEGPQWVGDGLYFVEAKVDGTLIKLTPPSTVDVVRSVVTAGTIPLGTTLDEKTNTLVTLEVANGAQGGKIVRTPVTGVLPRTGTPISLDAGVAFDSPNDVVARKTDGTLYITDPGYQGGAGVVTNHIWRVKPTTNDVTELQVAGRPNGIGLSPDEKTLYVSFTEPAAPPPVVTKYVVNVDGSLGAATKFCEVTPNDSTADGLAVDSKGNVYVAVKNGVDVFKPDGLSKWGHITTAKIINGLAFGGADKKTLFMTSDTGMLTVTVKIAGQVQ
jgi:gluconolactonase